MFLISMGVIGLSTFLVQFGKMSVMNGVLSMALKMSLVLIVLLAALLIWRWYKDSEI
jgi:hypothetical protein